MVNSKPPLAEKLLNVVVLEDDSVVKAPVLAVDEPIAVLLIPVAVVLKFPEVIVRFVAPVLIEEAVKPDKANAPLVAVRLSAPVVSVNPLEAVRSPAEVTVPVPLVEILPEVERTPVFVIDNCPAEPNKIFPVEEFPKEIVPAPLAFIVRFSSVPGDTTDIATPAPVAADFIFNPVVAVAVEASTMNDGFVVPFGPTAKALAELEVTVRAPVLLIPAVVNVPPTFRFPPMPTPPVTINAPVPVVVEAVLFVVTIVPEVETLPEPFTWNRSPLPTVRSAAGEVSPMPTLPVPVNVMYGVPAMLNVKSLELPNTAICDFSTPALKI